jgi:hypothetical protein
MLGAMGGPASGWRKMNNYSLLFLVLAGVLAAALLSAQLASAQATTSAAPPLRSQAATLEVDGGDTTTEHLCPTGYLISVSAHNGNANIPVVFVDRRHNAVPTGKWLPDAAGFRLQAASLFSVSVQMICSAP